MYSRVQKLHKVRGGSYIASIVFALQDHAMIGPIAIFSTVCLLCRPKYNEIDTGNFIPMLSISLLRPYFEKPMIGH